jgi:hypothetical protein
MANCPHKTLAQIHELRIVPPQLKRE